MTFFLRYKCRIQWYVEPCAQAPDSYSLQLFSLLSSSPVSIRSVLQCASAGNPDTFPFGKKHKGSWKHPGHTCAFSDPIPRVQKSCWARGEAAPPCWRSAIWSDWRKYNSCLQEEVSVCTMRRCVCAHAVLCAPQVRTLWKEELRWHNLSLTGLRCIRISAAKQRTE